MKSIALFLVVLMIWGVGLLAFASRIAQSTPPQEPEAADGIVVLTGRSSYRIEAAMALLERRKAERMLVSGVDRNATRKDIRGVARAVQKVYDCCVDLGFEAANTVGNARETEQWAAKHGFKRLIVVTADYHMPRSLLELHAAMPTIALTPYPVATGELDAQGWWRTGAGARRMILEYCKYLVILTREGVLKLGPKDHTRTPAPASPR
jgi:uncharacterized SAM-binding protein YcdF (DUF218 family)